MLAYEQAGVDESHGLQSLIMMMFCIIATSAPDLGLTIDEFLEWLDEDQKRFYALKTWMTSVNNQRSALLKREDNSDVAQDSDDASKKKI